MQHLLPKTLQAIRQSSGDRLFRPEFFTKVSAKETIGADMSIVAPILQYPDGEVKLGFNVGTRTNGVDQPRWPEDLSVQVVV